MRRNLNAVALLAALAMVAATALRAQEPSARQIAQERAQAELDAPKLAEVLELKPGMTVADIGAGFGAMTVVLGKWIGSGHVFATDIADLQLRTIREYAEREGLKNVTVIEGASASTNLPAACCDAICLRHVYHHIVEILASEGQNADSCRQPSASICDDAWMWEDVACCLPSYTTRFAH